MQKIAAGDADALSFLYCHLRVPLYSMASKMLPNRFEVEEIIQDVFVLVWQNAHKFAPDKAKVFTWLCMMVRNRCIDKIRSNGRRLPLASSSNEQTIQSEHEIHHKTAADQLQTRERAAQIRKAIDQLPKEQGEVIYLAFYAGMTHAQIAKKLGISLGTAKSRIRYAFERLSKSLLDGHRHLPGNEASDLQT